ncbi:MAG TPA: ATP-binding cassette domain-containing protein [Candidatus Dormibacteraeota bacterium]|nr:ATP-binding cassette domain-containing protein [Candidatus Dormibacteraeota bacterium]
METTQPALLDLQHISVMRGEQVVLHDVTLRIADGEHVAILGPNGSGKSTLIKTITREIYPLARPESRATIFGLERWNVFELRSLLGIVSNDLAIAEYESVTGLEAVLTGFFSSIGITTRMEVTPEMERRALAALARLEAAHLADRAIGRMSSGEERRVLIARALVHEPRALLLDEPSTSLDFSAQKELRRTMQALAHSGLGLVLVTHQLSDIVPEIERVILLCAGRVVGDGPKAEMLTTGHMKEIFGVDVEVVERDGCYHLW